jgi:hypothetical protein
MLFCLLFLVFAHKEQPQQQFSRFGGTRWKKESALRSQTVPLRPSRPFYLPFWFLVGRGVDFAGVILLLSLLQPAIPWNPSFCSKLLCNDIIHLSCTTKFVEYREIGVGEI